MTKRSHAPDDTQVRSLVGDERGAVLVMGLFFTIFCLGLAFAVYGIQEAAEYRESMQQAADAGALAGAQQYAEQMNRARNYAETEWRYVQATVLLDLLANTKAYKFNAQAGEGDVHLGMCDGGGEVSPSCEDKNGSALREAIDHAAVAGKFLKSDGKLKLLFGADGALLSDAESAVKTANAAWENVAGDFHANLQILKDGLLGPQNSVVMRCRSDKEIDPELKDDLDDVEWEIIFNNLIAKSHDLKSEPSITRRLNRDAREYSERCRNSLPGDGANCQFDDPKKKETVRFPYFYPESLRDVGKRGFLPMKDLRNSVRLAMKKVTDAGGCLPVLARNPGRYRVVVRAVGVDPTRFFETRRNMVFLGAFKEGGGMLNPDDKSSFLGFADAGQFALAQASFGLAGDHTRFVGGNGPEKLKEILRKDGIYDEIKPDRSEWSRIPMHLLGNWRANLTRLHFDTDQGTFNGGDNPCNTPDGRECVDTQWGDEINDASTH